MKKTIKSVEMVRKIRDNLYENTKGMNHKELIAFYHKESENARHGAIKRPNPAGH